MIKIERVGKDDIVVTPTIFPDGTSQVWKLPMDDLMGEYCTVVWKYESEVELLWMVQLLTLLKRYAIAVSTVEIPYVPYARQDKDTDNELTFARGCMLSLLPKGFVYVASDMHSVSTDIKSIAPIPYIVGAIRKSGADVVVFPDKGAAARYKYIIEGQLPYLICDKVRDQLTGKIIGLEFKLDDEVTDATLEWLKISSASNRYLIVDDLSDYGGTFKGVSTLIKDNDPHAIVSLYVTHFLGHGDFASFGEAGICRVYSTSSLNEYRASKGCDSGELIILD